MHTSAPTAEEENFFGKHTGYEPSPERLSRPIVENENGVIEGWRQLASGLTAVWAQKTRAHQSLTPWIAKKYTPPPDRASWCVSLVVGTTRSRTSNNRHPAFVG